MKNIFKYSMAAMLAMSLSNCTKNFEDINTNRYGYTDEELTQQNNHIGSGFSTMFNNIIKTNPGWNYQLQQNLNADVYSGYLASPTPFAGNINNLTYSLVDGWNGFIWSDAYDADEGNGVIPFAQKVNDIVENSGNDNSKLFIYLANTVKVMGMHRISDVFGPIRYSKYGDYSTTGQYDSQQTAYQTFFNELDQAIDGLEAFEEDLQFLPFDKSDFKKANGENIARWRGFANALRLRLAIRISKIDPALAKTEGEKSLLSNAGFLENGDMKVGMDGFSHPIIEISNGWHDIAMSAEMESILKGFKDPRISTYFAPPADASLGNYKGIRHGIKIEAKSEYESHSLVGSFLEGPTKTWMTQAEVHFLKAEAALRGWSGAGDSKTEYEMGVRAAFALAGAGSADAYLADNTSTPANYVDAFNPANNYVYPSTVKIAYDPAGTKEAQLEQIITQKWIAMFPDGQEAWSEFRRTGYPRVFPVVVNNSVGTISTQTQIRRINFVQSEKDVNGANVSAAVGLLNGPDTGGTRLWWDTGLPNF